MSRPVKFGQVAGVELNIDFPVAASVVWKHLGGNFVYLDANNRLAIATPAITAIIGWAQTGDYTASSTAGRDKVAVNIARDAIFEMPIDAARTEAQLQAIVGETCDIIVTSNIQYADFDASAIDVLEIMGYRYYGSASGEQTLLVRLYAPNITTKGGVV